MLSWVRAGKVRVPLNPERVPLERNDMEMWRTVRAELLRFVERRVHDTALAEDLVHDVLLKAYAQRSSLKDAGKVRPWLYQITRNALVDHFRSRRPLEPLPPDLAAESSADDHFAERELAHCLRPLLETLPGEYRDALTRSDFAGMTQREIATQEGLSLSGVKSRVQRARKMLRDAVLQCCRVEIGGRGGIVDYEPAGACTCCEEQRADRPARLTSCADS